MSQLLKLRRAFALYYRARTTQTRATIRDRRLANRLRSAFEQDLALADVRGLHMYAYNGIVTIYGAVHHELDRDLLVGFLRKVQGVRDVVEHLSVDSIQNGMGAEAPRTA